MTTTTTNYPTGRFNIEFRAGATYGDRCASITKQGDADFLAIFGTVSRNWDGGEQFDVSPSTPSKSYRTEAGARRAVSRWMGVAG
jgi:hypothetical protein